MSCHFPLDWGSIEIESRDREGKWKMISYHTCPQHTTGIIEAILKDNHEREPGREGRGGEAQGGPEGS